jgi:hypothetical protein
MKGQRSTPLVALPGLAPGVPPQVRQHQQGSLTRRGLGFGDLAGTAMTSSAKRNKCDQNLEAIGGPNMRCQLTKWNFVIGIER